MGGVTKGIRSGDIRPRAHTAQKHPAKETGPPTAYEGEEGEINKSKKEKKDTFGKMGGGGGARGGGRLVEGRGGGLGGGVAGGPAA